MSIEPKLPAVREAMASGEADGEHLHEIVKVIDKIPPESHDQADVDLADAARRFGPIELRQIGRKLIDVLDPDGDEPVDPTIVESQNELDIRDHEDGSMSGRPQKGDQRTLLERQGDALAEIIRFAANTGKAPIEGGERPHIAVTVSLETLRTAIGEATLDDGHSLTPEQVRRLACDAGVIPMVLGIKSQPIDIGESKRTADKRLRRALSSRDKGCAGPGCQRPANQCQAGEHGVGVPLPPHLDPPCRVDSRHGRRRSGVHATGMVVKTSRVSPHSGLVVRGTRNPPQNIEPSAQLNPARAPTDTEG